MRNNYNMVYGEIDYDQLKSEREDLRVPEDNKDMPVMLTPAQAHMREEYNKMIDECMQAERAWYSKEFDRYQH